MTVEASALESMSWEDVVLEGIAWADDGRALVLRMREPGKAERARIITLRWAHSLQLKLGLRAGHGGYPMTFEGEVSRLPDGQYALLLDLANDGEIRVICSELDIQVTD